MRIIHFSDFHLQGGKILSLHKINAEKLLDALRKINKQKEIDLVVFGGDLIDCGGSSFNSITDGFKTFEEIVLKPIMTEFELSHERIVIVPGNHDKDVSLLPKDADSLMKSLGSETKVTKFLFSDNSANENVKGMLDYYVFRDAFYNGIAEYFKSDTDFASCLKLQIEGKKIGIAMLNTAWGCTAKSGEEVLLGNAQVMETVDTIKDCEVKIAVMHHDISALIEYDRNAVKQPIMANFDLLLTGHIHGDESNYLEIPSGDSIIRSGVAGITVNNNEETDYQYRNGFHVIDMNVDMPSDVAITKYVQDSQYDFGVDKAFGDVGTWYPNKRVSLFEPLGNWVKRTKQTHAYLTNDKINSYMQDLKNSTNKIVKIVAFSGYGKTRMLFEAFKDLGSFKNRYYCNAVNENGVEILKQFNVVCQKITDGVGLVILDNCNQELQYRVLQDYEKFNYEHIRLILTSNAVNERNSEARIKEIRLERDILRKEVNQYVNANISEANSTIRENIKNIADGFPTMALSLVDEFLSENKVDIHAVDTLIERMVSHDTGLTDEQQTALQTLSLFQPLPYKQGDQTHPVYNKVIENSILLPLASADTNYRYTLVNTTINKCKDTFIEVGMENLNVRPYPLALWYVDKWFVGCGSQIDDLIEFVESLPEFESRTLQSCLCKRMEAVDDSPYAQKIVERWAQDRSFINEKVILSDMGSRLFLAMSHVNPVAIAKGLYAFFKDKDARWLYVNITGNIRRNYVNALEKLCFSKNSFEYGILLLAKFALAENENWGNNATGQFVQIFNILLPGTEADYAERVKALYMLMADSAQYEELVIKAVDTSFKNGSFSRMNGAEEFGLKIKQDYYPKSADEIREYWYACRDLLLQMLEQNKYVSKISKIVETHYFSWASNPLRFNGIMLPLVNKILDLRHNKWLKLYDSLFRMSLDANFETDYQGTKNEILCLIDKLRPNSFSNKFYEAWLESQVDFKLSEEETVQKHIYLFEQIAVNFVSKGIYANYLEIKSILDLDIYIDSCFFKKISEMMDDESLGILFNNILNYIIEYNGECERGRLSQFVTELSEKIEAVGFLEKIYSMHYEKLYVELLSKKEDDSLVILHQLENMAVDNQLSLEFLPIYLNSLRLLNPQQAVLLLPWLNDNLQNHVDEVYSFLQRYRYVIYPLMKKDEHIMDAMKSLLLKYPLRQENKLDGYWYSHIVMTILESNHDENFAQQINSKFMEEKDSMLDSKYVNTIYKTLLSKEYIDCIWDDFSRALYDDNYFIFYMNIRYDIGSGFGFENGYLFNGNDEKIKKLCVQHPASVPYRIAELAPCLEYEGEGENRMFVGFSQIIMWLINNFGEDKRVLDGIHENLHSFQWTGSLIPYYNRNITCFKQLLAHQNMKVRDWAKTCLELEEKDLKQELGNEEFDVMHYNL